MESCLAFIPSLLYKAKAAVVEVRRDLSDSLATDIDITNDHHKCRLLGSLALESTCLRTSLLVWSIKANL